MRNRHTILGTDDFSARVAILTNAEADDVFSLDVQSFLDDDLLFSELCEGVKAFHEVFPVAVNVQMVGINRVDDADVGSQLEEGTVELISFHNQEAVWLFA